MADQDSSTFTLTLIEYEGVRMFHHAETGRAICEIWDDRLPIGAEIQLLRRGSLLEQASVGGLPKKALNRISGFSPLVQKGELIPKSGGFEVTSIKAQARGLHLGDQIVLNFDGEWTHLYYKNPPCTPEYWFRYATYRSRSVALSSYQRVLAWKKIERLIPDKWMFAHFYAHNYRKPWPDALQAANRQASTRPPPIRSRSDPFRFT